MAYLTRASIDVSAWRRAAVDARDGASVEFLGLVRGHEWSRTIDAIDYECYAPMAERVIAQLVEHAQQRWPLHRVYVRHRVGRVPVGEAAVLVGVQAPHRHDAFAACQFLIDAIKCEVPLWKQAFDARGDAVEPLACRHATV